MGNWYDQIGVVCAQVQPNLTLTNKQFPRMHGGTGGGGPTEYSCNDDEIVAAMNPLYVEDNNRKDQLGEVAGLTLGCRSVKTGATRNLFVNAAYPAGSVLRHYPDASQGCPNNMVGVGLNVRFGRYVNAVGLICDTYVAPPPVVAQAPAKPIKTTGKAKGGASAPASPPGLLVCRFGPTMKPFGNPSPDAMLLTFDAAPQGANVALPAQGQCAWDVQPVAPGQAKRLGLGKAAIQQLTGIQPDTIFKVHAKAMTAFLMTTGNVEIVADGALAAAQAAVGAGASAEAGGQGGDGGGAGGGGDGGGMAAGIGIPSSGCPAGMATVQTPAGLDFLNVRAAPSSGAQVVAQVPNGSEVTVSGSCIDPVKGAGLPSRRWRRNRVAMRVRRRRRAARGVASRRRIRAASRRSSWCSRAMAAALPACRSTRPRARASWRRSRRRKSATPASRGTGTPMPMASAISCISIRSAAW
jgi:hypothetical protein